MRCPRCTTEVLEATEQQQAGSVASGELEPLEIHMCQRCGYGWVDQRQLMEILKRLRLAELSDHDRMLAEWVERFERALTKTLPNAEERR